MSGLHPATGQPIPGLEPGQQAQVERWQRARLKPCGINVQAAQTPQNANYHKTASVIVRAAAEVSTLAPGEIGAEAWAMGSCNHPQDTNTSTLAPREIDLASGAAGLAGSSTMQRQYRGVCAMRRAQWPIGSIEAAEEELDWQLEAARGVASSAAGHAGQPQQSQHSSTMQTQCHGVCTRRRAQWPTGSIEAAEHELEWQLEAATVAATRPPGTIPVP